MALIRRMVLVGSLKVRKLLEGSTALERGEIQIGDYLVAVGDLEITDKTTPEEVSQKVLGPAGQEVVPPPHTHTHTPTQACTACALHPYLAFHLAPDGTERSLDNLRFI